MKRVAFAIPGDLNTPTGGYAYDRRMIAELQSLGWQVDIIGLGDGFPRPDAATKAAARDKLAGVAKDCPITSKRCRGAVVFDHCPFRCTANTRSAPISRRGCVGTG